VRLFLAVWPPPAVVEAIGSLPRPPLVGARWTREEQWHVTLRFLGEVAEPEVAEQALSRLPPMGAPVVAEAGPAVACLGRRVLCIPVAGLEALAGGAGRRGRGGCRRPRRGWAGLPSAGRSAGT
jgi:hypothetical protein